MFWPHDLERSKRDEDIRPLEYQPPTYHPFTVVKAQLELVYEDRQNAGHTLQVEHRVTIYAFYALGVYFFFIRFLHSSMPVNRRANLIVISA
jgi:hypothetical protein